MSHTPGPWAVKGTEPLIAARVGTGDAAVISRIAHPECGYVHIDDYVERDSNARLIAAAPELLEACRTAHDYTWDKAKGTETAPPAWIRDNLKAAIAKATGTNEQEECPCKLNS